MPALGETDVIVGTPRRQHHQENGQQQDRQQQQRQQEIHGCQHSQGGIQRQALSMWWAK